MDTLSKRTHDRLSQSGQVGQRNSSLTAKEILRSRGTGLHNTRSPGISPEHAYGSPDKRSQAIVKTTFGLISQNELRDIRGKAERHEKPDATIISAKDLEVLRSHTIIKSPEMRIKEKRMFETDLDLHRTAATVKKMKMSKFDKEREKRVPPTQVTREQRERAEGTLSRAQMLIDEELDDVKKMNSMMLYSKVVTIRDKQLQEEKRLEQEYKEEQRRLDLMMEIERLKGLMQEDKRAEARQQAARESQQVLLDQIAHRNSMRIAEREQVEFERRALVSDLDKVRREEAATKLEKQLKARRMQDQVKVVNEIGVQMRKDAALKEKEEDEKIFKHVRDKQMAEVERQEAEQQMRLHKEREGARLRAIQEQAVDRQADIDALRAKRAFEDNERKFRQKEREELAKKARQLDELSRARQVQAEHKQMMTVQQAEVEKRAFERIIREHKEQDHRAVQVDEQRKEAYSGNVNYLKHQIRANSDFKDQARREYLEEGRKLRVQQADQILKLETIKSNKLMALQNNGIEGRYMSDLKKKQVKL